jgi:hypothetical protein
LNLKKVTLIMKKLNFLPVVLAFLMAISSAFVWRTNAALSTMKDADAANCPIGTLVQADTNCDTTDHSNGRCTVTVAGLGTRNAFNSSDASCQNALYKIN